MKVNKKKSILAFLCVLICALTLIYIKDCDHIDNLYPHPKTITWEIYHDKDFIYFCVDNSCDTFYRYNDEYFDKEGVLTFSTKTDTLIDHVFCAQKYSTRIESKDSICITKHFFTEYYLDTIPLVYYTYDKNYHFLDIEKTVAVEYSR